MAEPRSYDSRYPKLYTYNGQSLSIIEWARLLKINDATIRSRLKSGLTFEQAISKHRIPRQGVDKYEWKGEEHTLYQWSQILGIQYNTLRSRAKRGKHGAELFKQPNHMGHYREFGNFKY